MSEVTEAQLEDIEALFVQTAGRLTSDGSGQLTLEGVSPSTIYFADRPKREVGHMATSRFVDLWFGRPLSPVSVAGMHRRERRRMRCF